MDQITVEVFVKPYVAKYLENNYGSPVDLSLCTNIRKIFLQFLTNPSSEYDKRIDAKTDNGARKPVYIIISEYEFYNYGWELTLTNMLNFNGMIEEIIKTRMHDYMFILETIEKKITRRIQIFRDDLGFSEDDFTYDAIKKDFYRHRIKNFNCKRPQKTI